MSDPENTVPALMGQLRIAKNELEEIMTKAIRDFEHQSGLSVEDIELIHVMSPGTLSGLQVGAIKLTVRL